MSWIGIETIWADVCKPSNRSVQRMLLLAVRCISHSIGRIAVICLDARNVQYEIT